MLACEDLYHCSVLRAVTPNPIVLVVTDGFPNSMNAARTAAASLRGSPVFATIIAVAVNVMPGSPAATFLENDVASTGLSGDPLFVRLEDIDEFDPTTIVCCNIGAILHRQCCSARVPAR